MIALASNGFFDEARAEFQAMLDQGMPFRTMESAEVLARIAGVDLSALDRARVMLLAT